MVPSNTSRCTSERCSSLKIFAHQTFVLVAAVSMVLGSGCRSSYERFYTPMTDISWEPVRSVSVFEYDDHLGEVCAAVFQGYVLLGQAQFNGPMEDGSGAKGFARKLGADVVISRRTFIGMGAPVTMKFNSALQRNRLDQTAMEETTTDPSGSLAASGFASAGGHAAVGKLTALYNQHAYFLRNTTGMNHIWEQTAEDYPAKPGSQLQYVRMRPHGLELRIYESALWRIGVVAEQEQGTWKTGDVKFVFNPSVGRGIFLDENRKPLPILSLTTRRNHLRLDIGMAQNNYYLLRKLEPPQPTSR